MAKEKFIKGKHDDCKHEGLRASRRRLEEAESKLYDYLMERDKSFKDIIHGQKVNFNELKPDDYYDTFEALRSGHFTGQRMFPMEEVGLDGGMLVEAVNPIIEVELTPEQEYLLRPTQEELKWNKRIV